MRRLRGIVAALPLLLASLAVPQGPQPRAVVRLTLAPYFSGTNCRVAASSEIFGTHIGVNRFTMTLSGGGESQTWTATQDWGGEPPGSEGLGISKVSTPRTSSREARSP